MMMRVSCRHVGVILLISGLAAGGQYAYGQDAVSPPSSAPAIDIQPPVIEHNPNETPIAPGQSTVLNVKVTDDVNVREVTLFYRSEGDAGFKSVHMVPTGDAQYSATLSSTDTRPPGVEYFIQAIDDAGNSVWRASKLFPLKLVVDAQPPVAGAAVSSPPAEPQPASEARAEPSKWWWVLGALAAGAVIAAAGGGDDGGGSNPTATPTPPSGANGSVQVTAPTPP